MSGITKEVTVRVKVEYVGATGNPTAATGGSGGSGGGPGGGGGGGGFNSAAKSAEKEARDRAKYAEQFQRASARAKAEAAREEARIQREAERARSNQQRAAEKAKRDEEKAAKEKSKAEKEATDKAKEFAAQQKDAVTEAASASLEGVTKLARGFIYLTASSKESMEANVKLVERFEGTVSTIEGGISMTMGLVKTYQTLRATALATAAANATLAASQVAVNATAKGGGVAAGAAGVGSAAAGGAMATVVGLGKMIVTVAKPFIATVGLLAAKLAALTIVVAGVYELFGMLTGAKTRIISDLLGLKGDREKAASSEARAAKMEKNRGDRLDKVATIDENLSEQAAAARQIADAQREGVAAANQNVVEHERDRAITAAMVPIERDRAHILKEMARSDDPLLVQQGEDYLERLQRQEDVLRSQTTLQAQLNLAAEARANAAQRVQAAEDAVEVETKKVNDAIRAGELPARAAQLAALEEQRDAQRDLVQEERNRLGVLQSTEDSLRNQASASAARIQSIQTEIRLEKEKERSGAAKFGRLTAPAQGVLQRINQKLKSGEGITDQEARFLDEKGFGERVTEEHFATKGRKAGFGGLDSRLTGFDRARQDELRNDEQQERGRLDTLIRDGRAARAEIRAKQETLHDEIRAMTDTFLQALEAQRRQIETEARRVKAATK